MDLGIDRQALVPVVQQIVSAVAVWIRESAVSPGTRLPSIRKLAHDNLLSQSSVVEAFERMVAEGLLASRHGSGFSSPSNLPPAASGARANGMRGRSWVGGALPITNWVS